MYGTCLAFMIICARLFYLQINLTHHLSTRSQNNFLQFEKVESLRGNILDRNGNLLATNRPVIRVYWQSTGNNSLSRKQIHMLSTLENLLNINITHNESLLNSIKHAERYRRQVVIAQDIAFEHLSKIAEQLSNNKNLLITTHFERYYPYGSMASHILGYLGQVGINRFGRMGLEKLFEGQLKGKKGSVVKVINSVGRNIAQTSLKKALAGEDIQTTLNISLQHICERIFPKSHSGTCILMDPIDGSILSLISRPNFDPSIFLKSIPHEQWQDLIEQKPFINRAFSATYPPGSIFKLITICAALENGIIEPDKHITCKGFDVFGRRKYWCNRRYGHGELSIAQAVAQSCNILFFEIGKQIDIDTLAEYAYKFGLGTKTNIIFPEQQGLVPTREWKEEIKGERWWPGETLSVAIGQSFLLATPIQVARMIASIFTGYLVTPRLLLAEPVQKIALEIEPSTRAFLRKSMKSVVTQGTGKRVNTIKDIEIYAKTSTAQTSAIQKRSLGTQYREHGCFVAYFRYKDLQPLIIVILAEHAGTAQVATTIAKNFLIEYKKLMDSYHK